MCGGAYMSSRDGATWRSGYATVCKTVYTSSILVVASINIINYFHIVSKKLLRVDFALCSASGNHWTGCQRRRIGRQMVAGTGYRGRLNRASETSGNKN